MSTTPERNDKGQFAKGNPGGPGNPFARQVAALRKALLDAVTPEIMTNIINALIIKAQTGDLAAAKLLLSYTLGKPAPAVNPDTLDLEEFEQLKEEANIFGESVPMMDKPAPEMPLNLLRTMRKVQAGTLSQRLGQALSNPDQFMQQLAELEIVDAAPSPNGSSGGRPPSPNESIGAQQKGPAQQEWEVWQQLLEESRPSPNGQSKQPSRK